LAFCYSLGSPFWPLPKGLFKESDTYWLIEVGRTILHHFALPTTDPYSFASLGTPWIVYQWLTEVVLALANTFALKGVAILGEVTLGLLLCLISLWPRMGLFFEEENLCVN